MLAAPILRRGAAGFTRPFEDRGSVKLEWYGMQPTANSAPLVRKRQEQFNRL